MRRALYWMIALPLIFLFGGVLAVRAGADLTDSTIALLNGEKITVRDLRESLGLWGGGVSATGISLEKKKETLTRLIDFYLLAQSARAKGLDNTEEFRDLVKRNEQGLYANALLRQEAATRVVVTEADIKAEAVRLGKEDKNLSREDARKRAKGAVWEKKMGQVEEEVTAAARKEVSAKIDEEAISRIGKGESVDDNTVLGTAGDEVVRYGDVKKRLERISGGRHGGQDLSTNPDALRNLVNREVSGKALALYAHEQMTDPSEWLNKVRKEAERSILVNLLMEKVVLKGIKVTDKEIADAYAKHSRMLIRDGKPIPLSEVKEDILRIVQNDKRKAALDKYAGQLRKKAKIKIYEKLLPNV